MVNILDLFEVRIGQESTAAWGTEVAQSHKLMGMTGFSITPMIPSQQIMERYGSLQPAKRAIPGLRHATATLEGTLDYEYPTLWLDGMFDTATPSQDTDIYTYTYSAPDGTAAACRSYTIAYGNENDAASVHNISGATVNSFSLSGATGEPITYSIGFIGKNSSTDTFDSAAEADSTVTTVRACDISLYIDPATDAAGSTEVASSMFDFDLSVNCNRNPYWHIGSTDCTPTAYRPGKWDGSLRLALELNATSEAYLTSLLATSATTYERVVRIVAANGENSFTVDFNGIVSEVPEFVTDNDGISTLNITFQGQYNSVLANWLKFSVVNTIATVP